MKKIIFIYLLIGMTSCWNNSDGRFPYKNKVLPINKVKLYKSYLFINDTISFTGAYYQKDGTYANEDEKILYGNLHVGDTLITDNYPKDYVIRRRDGTDTKFYRWPLNEN